MKSTWYLSRAVLLPSRGDPSSQFWRHVGNDASGHGLVWTLFRTEESRNFLYRQEGVGPSPSFLVLSSRPPENPEGLWSVETKTFAPQLVAKETLDFSIRVNPTRRRSNRGSGPVAGKRVDVVMDAKAQLPAEQRRTLDASKFVDSACRSWLEAKSEASGFRVLGCSADGYRQLRLPRRGTRPATISTVDLKGTLEVLEPDLFVDSVVRGFGTAKAFGCGLMLVRRT